MTESTQHPSEGITPSSNAAPPRVDHAVEELKSNVAEKAHDVSEGVKHLASDVIGQTKKTAASQIDLGKSRAVEGLGSVASALRKTGESLREEDNDMLTGVIDSAAQRVDAASGYLKDKSFSDILVDMKGFARREPALFLGGALVVGLLGGRFLKASTPAVSSTPNAPPRQVPRLSAPPMRASAPMRAGGSTPPTFGISPSKMDDGPATKPTFNAGATPSTGET